MKKKVLLTGATGMVGKGVLLECLDHPAIGEVVAIGRHTTGMEHPKLTEVVHRDFTDFTPIRDRLEGVDACFYCLGVSSAGMQEEDYRRITYDYTLSLARLLVQLNPGMTFIYVSGQGTDSSEQGRSMWARVKGKTENDLLALGFRQAFMFRPGMIIPLKGIRSRTRLYQFFYDYFLWLIRGIKILAPNSIVTTTQIGLAMIHCMLQGCSTPILAPRDIIQLSGIPPSGDADR
ncbi:MAG: NAD-dependent epimerase/dehydratase family protein [Candidatus Neomarinimicrobiota bacterium]|nr:MAG: NAD-dependent epimerase/dehydratase family protein [Candidatus Neomarinimicrobiota bacterium]